MSKRFGPTCLSLSNEKIAACCWQPLLITIIFSLVSIGFGLFRQVTENPLSTITVAGLRFLSAASSDQHQFEYQI